MEENPIIKATINVQLRAALVERELTEKHLKHYVDAVFEWMTVAIGSLERRLSVVEEAVMLIEPRFRKDQAAASSAPLKNVSRPHGRRSGNGGARKKR